MDILDSVRKSARLSFVSFARILTRCVIDPFKLCEVFDTKWMQQSEIKHGRIVSGCASGFLFAQTTNAQLRFQCMLAFVGILAQEFVHLPGAVFSNPLATEVRKQGARGIAVMMLTL